MTDYGIIFSAPMVRAFQAGRKTMTRRLAWRPDGKPTLWQKVKPGDRLWVRETLTCSGALVQYAADHKTTQFLWPAIWKQDPRPSMFMPRRLSRLTLTVTAAKVEQLHGVSQSDALDEGIAPLPQQDAGDPSAWWESAPGENQARTPRESFRKLWNSLHGAGAWDLNPELVAMSFTVEQRNIDKVAA